MSAADASPLTLVGPPGATLLIDGQWKTSESGKTFASINPATGESNGQVSQADQSDVDEAVAAARKAFDERRWLKLPTTERAKILVSLADKIEARLDELIVNEVREVGMPTTVARWSILDGAESFRYNSGWITRPRGIAGEIAAGSNFHAYSRKEPMGVAALIVPWNGPFMLACHKISAALAAGCSVILKPAELTSLNILHLGVMALDAGVPPGVFNIVTGDGETGGALTAHAGVNKVSFTGSTEVGRSLVKASAGNFKRLSLELGGKSPVIVMNDADLEQAVPAIISGIMINTGQACIAGSRLYAHRSIYDRLVRAVADAASKMVIGNGLDDGTEIGPLISQTQFDRVMGYIDTGKSDGAEVVTGGRRHGDSGLYIEPTILSKPPATSKAVREEIFGPVLVTEPFDDVETAIQAANDSPYGLVSAVYTRSLEHAHRIAAAIQAGTVFINCHGMLDFAFPFGGYKQSGWSRENGAEGVDAFMETKSVFAKLF